MLEASMIRVKIGAEVRVDVASDEAPSSLLAMLGIVLQPKR